MAKTNFQSADDYISTFPANVQDKLRAVRAAIREGAPDAEEGISYQMPAFRLNGRWLIYFAAFARHYSLYCPQPAGLLDAFGDELSQYGVSKSTIKFPLQEPVPVDLIRRMATHRAAEFSQAPTRSSR
jgi:uncharacterized protein YdhG (YjbR/CyaY superfamily)